MQRVPIDLGRQSNPGRYAQAGAARLINLRAENAGDEGRVKFPIYAVSGIERWGGNAANTGGIKAMLVDGGRLVVAAGRYIASVDTDGVVTEQGVFIGQGTITMARNGRETGAQVGIVSDDGVYYLLTATSYAQVTDPDLIEGLTSICYLGGYFFYTGANGRWQWSELDAGDEIDGLSISSARSYPDDLVVCKARGRDLLLFGVGSMEIWTLNDGGGDAPVSFRSASRFGALSIASTIEVGDSVYWLATDDQGAYVGVMALTGDQPRVVSYGALDRLIADEASPEDIIATRWTEDGRTYVAWSGTGWTWVYDIATGLWHERQTEGSRWRCSHCANFNGDVIAGDTTLPYLYRMHKSIYADGDTEMVCRLRTPPVYAFPERIEMHALYVDVLTGQGTATGGSENTAPQISMRYADDGANFGVELMRDLGAQGQLKEVAWRRLGTTGRAGRTIELSMSAGVARGLFSASADVDKVAP